MVSSYAMFVKEHIDQFKHLPAKQRMKAVAELYHKQKSGASHMPAKKGKGSPKKGGVLTAAGLDNKGGSILGDIVPFGHMLGLGLDEKHKKGRGRPKKGGAMTAAGLNPYAHVQSPLMNGSGGGFGDWFFKGLTAPFALASKIPLPGLQQIGEAGTKAFNAIGAPTLF